MTMRFEYYHPGIEETPKLSVDGTVPNSIHFSHWQGNQTPSSVKADTSTEIALNLVGSSNRQELTRGIELITNNHFDTDGVLSVWTVLMGERALELREELVAAAEAGDFSEYTGENGVRASIIIQGSEQASPDEEGGSPLARYLAGESCDDEARAYQLVLPEVERVLTHTDEYEQLWRSGWRRVAAAMESFESGRSRVEEHTEAGLSLITLAPEVFSAGGFNPTRHAAPYTAISHYARGQVYLIATPLEGGWSYRIDYPYYSWAETVVRPAIERRDLTTLIGRLNHLEKGVVGNWKPDSGEMTSAVKFLDPDGILGVSSLEPDRVAEEMIAALSEAAAPAGGTRHA